MPQQPRLYQNESVCTDITIEHMNSVNMHEHSRILLSDTKESTLKLEHKATTHSTTRDELEASPELSRKLCYSPDSMESIPRIQACPQ